MVANMWKNRLKNAESDNNKISYETLLEFFLQLNCTYFLNKPRINNTKKMLVSQSSQFLFQKASQLPCLLCLCLKCITTLLDRMRYHSLATHITL
jgi:hypothetical protein